MAKRKISLIIKNASQLITLDSSNPLPRYGSKMNELGIIKNGAIAIHQNKILEIGSTKKIMGKYQASHQIDAYGKVVTPGLVDPHTHLVFAGDRSNEFEMRLKGATYQQITAAGGGINATVRATRIASKNILVKHALDSLKRFLNGGTTTLEAKSGYGLNLKDEIKILEVIKDLNSVQPVSIVPTFLGAHEIPKEYRNNKTGYIKLINKGMLPIVAKRKLAEFCDVFCEKGVFEIDESRQILNEAKKYGLSIKLHADEFVQLGGGELAAELKATSADHLMACSDKGIQKMKEKGVIAVLLPGTTFTLGLTKYAPARKMIDSGLAVALATDFNPGTSFTESMPLIMTLACIMMKMTPAEALTAATINAAYAVKRGEQLGSLTPQKQADVVIWQIPTYQHICYHFGVNLVEQVIKRGKVVVKNI